MSSSAEQSRIQKEQRYNRNEASVDTLPGNFFEPFIDAEALSQLDIVHIAATVAGAKTGSIFIGLDEEDYRPVVDILDQGEIPHRLFKPPTGKDIQFGHWLAIASTTDAYDEMPPYETVPNLLAFDGENARLHGSFLGVPEEDNCWRFELDTGPVIPMFERCDIRPPMDAEYLRLVSYCSRPTVEGVERAVEQGKLYYKACQQVEKVLDEPRPLYYADMCRFNSKGGFYHSP